MAEAKEVHETGEIEHISTQIMCSRDLLKRFKAGNHHHPTDFVATTGKDEEIELNLGLSLGGCFGVNPRENNNRLVRSSSIAGLTTLLRDDDAVAQPPVVCPSLIRTGSLPMETEEEWRKRKELQTLRRMEAKRKRSEKQKNFRAGKDRAPLEGNCQDYKLAEEEAPMPFVNPKGNKVDGSTGLSSIMGGAAAASKQQQQQQQQHVLANGLSSSVAVAPPFGLSNSAATLVRGMDASSNGNVNVLAAAALRGCPPPSSSQGSLGSQGSSSSGISEFESRPVQGRSNCTDARSPSSVQSWPERQIELKSIVVPRSMTETSGTPGRTEVENETKKPKLIDQNGIIRETGMKVMEEMPCVSTTGDGPNGKRIEGFLYKYRKGEEVRIVCVCHGNFLSPAEFVKHAGGGDVAHPLRHIVVNPPPSFLS